MGYKTLKEKVDVTILLGKNKYNTVSYLKVKSKHYFHYAGEKFFITPYQGIKNGFVATHERTGRTVEEELNITVSKAYKFAIEVLDNNAHRFEAIHKYPSIPDKNLSLDLALKNLL